jgi:hypothetical protein
LFLVVAKRLGSASRAQESWRRGGDEGGAGAFTLAAAGAWTYRLPPHPVIRVTLPTSRPSGFVNAVAFMARNPAAQPRG